MKIVIPMVVVMATLWLPGISTQHQALFIKRDAIESGRRVTRQTSADQMVQNILQWLQGVYQQNSRRIRQGSLREYLPPSNTQRPRPFQPQVTGPASQPDESNFIGYPAAGSITPQPPFTVVTNPATGGITGGGYPAPSSEYLPPDQGQGYPGPEQPYPTERPQEPEEPQFPGYQPGIPTQRPPYQPPGQPSTQQPGGYPTTGYPTTGYPTPPPPQETTGYPSYKPTGPTFQPPGSTYQPPGSTYQPPGSTYQPPGSTYRPPGSTYQPPGSTYQPSGPTTGYPTYRPTGPSTGPPTGYPTYRPPGTTTLYPPQEPQTIPTRPPPGYRPGGPSTFPPVTRPDGSTEPFTSPTTQRQPSPEENNIIPTEGGPGDSEPTDSETTGTIGTPEEEDLKHPPHIHEIDVQCAKDMMTINIEFNRQFDGVIYSKGFYNNPECRYVKENSGQKKYSFTVSLNSCGTEFINAFDTEGKSYLENVLVLQNEPGIQEVWDTIRAVRCLWEGNLNKALSVALSVGMLSQEIVTFSGDTAMARLDIQLGKGPFAPNANGLVKIGEVMTLVVSVTGDAGFDIQVKDCRARDSTGENVVALTDENGCVLKPKLFGAFQKTRETGNTGASIIAYAFFNAFKFPDVMDLMLECNVELCKTDCQVCPNPDQKLEPGRRRKRDLEYYNQTIGDGVTVGKLLRVILPEDLSDGEEIVRVGQYDGVCLTTLSFLISSVLMISLLTFSCVLCAYLWLKNQTLHRK